MTTTHKSSPRELREWKPRLRFNYRCVECGEAFSGAANENYHCGQYAAEEDECERCGCMFGVGTLRVVGLTDKLICDECAAEIIEENSQFGVGA